MNERGGYLTALRDIAVGLRTRAAELRVENAPPTVHPQEETDD